MAEVSYMALDKSARSYDVDGRLTVSNNRITKATVSPYIGYEIPNWEMLGLDKNKVYNLLRDPAELAKAASSFANLPVLLQHKPSTADDHPKELTVGTSGSEVTFDAPYLCADLVMWAAEAIAGIETKIQTEISCGYRYRPDMTPGEYEGTPYDGVMRDIVGNHIALVDIGRAGPDVVVADSTPPTLRGNTMSKIKLSRKAAAINGALRATLKPMLAQDAVLPSLAHLLQDVKTTVDRKALKASVVKLVTPLLAKDAKPDYEAAMDAGEEDDIMAGDEDDDDDDDKDGKKKVAAMDDEPDAPPGGKKAKENDKPAMDSNTVQKMIDEATAKVRADTNALHAARQEVAPIVGEVALDSAEAVYKFALDKLNVDVEGVHPSAYRSMVKLAQSAAKPAPRIAQDAASNTVRAVTVTKFPHLARFGNNG